MSLSHTGIQHCTLFQQCPQEVIQYAGNNAHITYIHLYAQIFPAAASLQETLVCFPDVCVSVCYFWHGCALEYTYRHTDKETYF